MTPRVILVDGKEFAQLMIEHAVGVTVARRYEVKRLDLDYFVTDDEVQAEPLGVAADERAANTPSSEPHGT